MVGVPCNPCERVLGTGGLCEKGGAVWDRYFVGMGPIVGSLHNSLACGQASLAISGQ